MDVDLKKVLASHAAWLAKTEAGRRADLSRADLSRADLSRADLSRADLSGADLSCANLAWARLVEANLAWARLVEANLAWARLVEAKLASADLSRANLAGAFLENADLFGACLAGADLSQANLAGACLAGADLSRAVLSRAILMGTVLDNANLSGTCLDPVLLALQRRFVRECPPDAEGYRVVYRTAQSIHMGGPGYEPRKTYTAPAFSCDPATECHPGIYAGSWSYVRREFPGERLVRCRVRDGDWIITPKGAIRCARLEVLEALEE